MQRSPHQENFLLPYFIIWLIKRGDLLNIIAVLSIHRCYNLSNDYYKYVKMYWVEDNDLMDLKKIITMEKRKRIIAEL